MYPASPGTFYYRAFVMDAFLRCGWRDRLEELTAPFSALLEGTGLTTWPERDDPESRSDCHGWSVLPALVFDELDPSGMPRVGLVTAPGSPPAR